MIAKWMGLILDGIRNDAIKGSIQRGGGVGVILEF